MADTTGYLWLKTLHVIYGMWFSVCSTYHGFLSTIPTEETVGYKRFNDGIATILRDYLACWDSDYLVRIWMLYLQPERLTQPWLYGKLSLVACLWVFHLSCGYYLRHFQQFTNRKQKTSTVLQQFPTIILCLLFT